MVVLKAVNIPGKPLGVMGRFIIIDVEIVVQ
jgi:hypothetical protein